MTNVELIKDGHVALVRWQPDGPVTTLSRGFTADLDATLDTIEHDDEVRCAVLTGTGPSFVVGADVKELLVLDVEENLAYNERLIALTNHCASLPIPVIACVNGHAFGGGLELALACTIRVAADTAKMGLPEVKLGIVPGAGGTIRLPRTVAPGAAMLAMLTGRTLSAQEGHRIGLLDLLAPPEEAQATALAVAHEIASRAPLAVRTIVAATRAAQGVPTEEAIEDVHSRLGALLRSDDAQEGIAAFIEKRPATFTGA